MADTSIWVEHLRGQCPELAGQLSQRTILVHPFVVGELALGQLRQGDQLLRLLRDQPQAPVASPDEVLQCILRRRWQGAGIGYVDSHLLASVLLQSGTRLWTLDQRLRDIAQGLGLAYAGTPH